MVTYLRLPGTPIRRLGIMLIAGGLAMSALLWRSAPAHAQTTPMEAVITSDNGYGFGYGDDIAIYGDTAYLGKVENCSDASQIFSCTGGPERYLFNAPDTTTFLYLVAWADDSSKQGVLGQFRDVSTGGTIYTGIGPWEVYRTNQRMISCDASDPQGPPLVGINTQINHATSNKLWKPVTELGLGGGNRGVIGEDNSVPGGTFGPACPNPPNSTLPNAIGTAARWMWFDSTANGTANPFLYAENAFNDYLIFRLPIRSVKDAGCMTLQPRSVSCEPGPLGPSGCHRVRFQVINGQSVAAKFVSVNPVGGGSVTPGVIELPNPIGLNQQATVEFVWCPPANFSGTSTAFSVTLLDEQAAGCCARRLTVEVPECPSSSDCLQIPTSKAICTPGADPGTFDLSLYVKKESTPAKMMYLVAPASMSVSPQPKYLGPVAGTFGPISYTIKGAPANNNPRTVCFWVNLQPLPNENEPYGLDGSCCSERVCVQVPYCGLPTPRPDPIPASDGSGGTGGG